jgi:hypothetical protein
VNSSPASNVAYKAEEKRKADDAAKLKRQVFWSRIFAASAVIALLVVGVIGSTLYGANKNLAKTTKEAHASLSSALTALAFTEVEERPVDAVKLALAAWPRRGAMDLPKREVTLNAVSHILAGLPHFHKRRCKFRRVQH